MSTRNGLWRWGGVVPALLVAAAASGQQPAPAPAPDVGKRVAAFIHGSTQVTREELGEYLIARGGMDKIDLLVNRKVVELEAAKRGITVTPLEVSAGVNEDLQSSGLSRDEFVQVIRSRYGKSLYEWEQDVVRQRLLLGKMTRAKVSVTEDEVRKAFETKHGERREAFVINWPKGKDALPEDVKKLALEKHEEFEKLALRQPNEFAKTGGKINPVGRHVDGEDPRAEQALFSLKQPGDAVWVETEGASICVRLIRVIPPDPVTFEQVKATLEKDVFDRKLSRMLPEVFNEVRAAANPQLTQHVPPRPAADPNAPVAPRAQHPDPKVLAVLYGNTPVTRTDLGEFLIARGGYEKLESLVNLRIVHAEAAKRNLTATPEEIEATLVDNLKAINIEKADFVKTILPKAKKTLEEYVEDEIRPTILLRKMCKDKVQVTDDDLKKAFDRHFGEKREAKIIMWQPGQFRQAQRDWEKAREGDAQFDQVARAQFDPNLASGAGKVSPIGRHGDAPSPAIEDTVFKLKVGELSHLFQTQAGILCIKCTGVIPPQQGVDPAKVRPALEKEVIDRKLAQEVAATFAALRAAANPNLILRGPPTERENQEGVEQILNQAGVTVPKR
ncbi:peptidylprolyl isomerase [bacterium]|nr:peptidylprolyl isomerase [bacterium]